MKTFTLIPEAFWREHRPRVIVQAVTAALIIPLVLFASHYNSPESEFNPWLTVVTIGFLCAVTANAIVRGIRAARARWRSVVLELTEQDVTMFAAGAPTVRLMRSDVRTIEERRGGVIIVHGPSKSETITIPHGVADRAELRALLESWHAIEQSSGMLSDGTRNVLLTIGSMALAAGAFTRTTPWIVVPCGLVLGATALTYSWRTLHSRTASDAERTLARVLIIPALAAIANAASVLWQ